jgi:hypothetical protein
VSERDELPRAILERALQNIRVFVTPEHAEIAGLLAVPSIDACFYLNGSGP